MLFFDRTYKQKNLMNWVRARSLRVTQFVVDKMLSMIFEFIGKIALCGNYRILVRYRSDDIVQRFYLKYNTRLREIEPKPLV